MENISRMHKQCVPGLSSGGKGPGDEAILHSMETVYGRWSGSLEKYKSQKRYLLQYAKVPYVT